MTPILTSDPVEPPGGVFDIVIAAAGFETRARFLAHERAPVGRQRIAFGFPDRQELAYVENVRWFKEAGYRVETVNDEEFSAEIRRSFQRAAGDSPKVESAIVVWVDISSFTRVRLAIIVQEMRSLAMQRALRVLFLYNIAKYSDPAGDPLPVNAHAGPVMAEFAGWSANPDMPPIALVGLGYEEGKALGAVEYLQADEIWAFDPYSPIDRYREALDSANQLLMELCPTSRLIHYQVADPVTLFSKLEALVFAVKGAGRPHILPFGPKIFALVSLLVALVHPEVAVWRVSAGAAEQAIDRLPSEHTIVLGMELTSP